MQTNKLGLSQKLFGQLERLFHKTAIREVPLNFRHESHLLLPPRPSACNLPMEISSPALHNIMSDLSGTKSHIVELWSDQDLRVSSQSRFDFTATVHTSLDLTFSSPATRTIPIDTLNIKVSHEHSCQMTQRSIRTLSLDLHPFRQVLRSHSPLFTFQQVSTRFNRLMALQIPIHRSPIPTAMQSKPELRVCWRKAVQKTKRSPQEIKQLAFFSGVPLKEIKKIEFRLDPIRLTYWLKENPAKSSAVSSLALFRNDRDHSCFLTSSSDE